MAADARRLFISFFWLRGICVDLVIAFLVCEHDNLGFWKFFFFFFAFLEVCHLISVICVVRDF